jgi:NitT/TauT family transport system substrate-binding protein
MKKTLLTPLVLALCAGTLHCDSDDKPNPKLRVGMLHWAAYGPLNVADAKGLWKAEGVDVEIVNRISNQELNADLTSGRIDVALDMMGSWVGLHIAGTPLKIIGETDWSYGGDQVIAKKTLDRSKLKGQEVAIYLDQPSVTFFLGKYLETIGEGAATLKLADVSIKELETKAIADAFAAGTYQLTVNYEPESAKQLEDTAQGEKVATSASPGFEGVIPEGFVGRADILAKVERTTLKKFIKGWQKAVSWVYADADGRVVDEAHWAEYADILRTKTFEGDRTADNPYTDQELRQFVSNVKVHGANQQLCVNGPAAGTALKASTAAAPQPLRDYLNELKAFLEVEGKLAGANPALTDFTNDASGIFDNSVVVEALTEMGATCNR